MGMNDCTDVLIIGSGMVGLSIAWQLMERNENLSITLVDKESDVGKHGSGRNSGVLHAGVYYPPTSLKARVCVKGGRRLREWCEQEKLPILYCGKVITPQRAELDAELDLLLERGKLNGATVEIIDQQQFTELVPDGRTSTGRALWSQDTSVVKPLTVIQRLRERLHQRGATFVMSQEGWEVSDEHKQMVLSDRKSISYDHLFNCGGLQADRIAHRFGVGVEYTMLPFKGGYYQFREGVPFQFNTNLYPVPDLEVPFLGVHVTPSVDGITYLGPTATPALGRENYTGLKGVEPVMAFEFFRHMVRQVVSDKKMRRYVQDQAFDWMPHKFLAAAKAIVPKLEMNHIQRSKKVGIRPQLYDRKKNRLVQDFIVLDGPNSTHVINAISPAFTASFELADLILENTQYNL